MYLCMCVCIIVCMYVGIYAYTYVDTLYLVCLRVFKFNCKDVV